MTRSQTVALLWCVIVLVGCSVPGSALPRGPIWSFDKVIHVALFIPVGALWLRALPGRVVGVLVGAALFGIGIEIWQQMPLVGRSADPFDAVADVVGAGVGLGLETARARWARARAER